MKRWLLPSAFSVDENWRLTFMYVSAMRAYEARYLQIRLGVLDEEIVESMSGASAMFDDAWFAERWRNFKPNVGAGFAQFMEERYELPLDQERRRGLLEPTIRC